MDSAETYWADRALLEWQVELGATDAISDTPVDRYALEAATPKPAPVAAAKPDAAQPPATPDKPQVDAVAEAGKAAQAAGDITALTTAIDTFAHCDLKRGARNTVVATGSPASRIMIVGEAPNRAEDRAGTPFVGEEGQLLDKMLAAIGFARDAADPATAAYLVAPIPWRTPSDGPPDAAHMAMMTPFLERHITIAQPDALIIMGNTGLHMLTGKGGLTRVRGHWIDILGRPAIPMMHPAQLLRTPLAKREAWADLLNLKAKLKDTP